MVNMPKKKPLQATDTRSPYQGDGSLWRANDGADRLSSYFGRIVLVAVGSGNRYSCKVTAESQELPVHN